MDKISGIIPSSPRVTAVDLRDSAPVRPGTPSFGRREGVSSLREPIPMEAPRRASLAQAEMVGWKSKDMEHAAMVQEMSNRFFIKSRDLTVPSNNNETKAMEASMEPSFTTAQITALTQRPISSNPAGFNTPDVAPFSSTISPLSSADSLESLESIEDEISLDPAPTLQALEAEEAVAPSQQPPGLYPKGSFIDFSA